MRFFIFISRCVLNYLELVEGNFLHNLERDRGDFLHNLELVFGMWTKVVQQQCFGIAAAT
jgi:hypothetical protein